MANDSKVVPVPVLRRMPAYLSFVKTLQKQGEKYVSSTRIAEYMEIDATQVTKDLSHTGISGKTRVGYEVDNFVEILDDFLGFNKINNAFLVGAGSLGCALLQDKGLRNFGLNIQKAFDVDKSKIGTKINDVEIFHVDQFRGMPGECNVAIGIITVPAECAQNGILPRPGLKYLLILPCKTRRYTRTWPFYLINYTDRNSFLILAFSF